MENKLLVLLIILTAFHGLYAQERATDDVRYDARDSIAGFQPTELNDKTIKRLNARYSQLTNDIDRQSVQLLNRLEKQETRLQQKMMTKDSVTARQLFAEAGTRYEALKARLQLPGKITGDPLKEYIPGLDSMQTLMKYLSLQNLPAGKLLHVQNVNQQLQQLQGKLQLANEVQD